ncbi:hypothetical protein [Lacticaseibacillus daqingensis]|nr:hypothetical protein [Lacticaseibacillus daqingensis]
MKKSTRFYLLFILTLAVLYITEANRWISLSIGLVGLGGYVYLLYRERH